MGSNSKLRAALGAASSTPNRFDIVSPAFMESQLIVPSESKPNADGAGVEIMVIDEGGIPMIPIFTGIERTTRFHAAYFASLPARDLLQGPRIDFAIVLDPGHSDSFSFSLEQTREMQRDCVEAMRQGMRRRVISTRWMAAAAITGGVAAWLYYLQSNESYFSFWRGSTRYFLSFRPLGLNVYGDRYIGTTTSNATTSFDITIPSAVISMCILAISAMAVLFFWRGVLKLRKPVSLGFSVVSGG